jgi:polygalacturonase
MLGTMARGVTRRQVLAMGLGTGGLWALGGGRSAVAEAARARTPWPEADAILAATRLPDIPDALVDVRDLGARGDGRTDDTDALRRAIESCHTSGGGHVVVSPGTYLTGAIELKSQVDLHLEAGASLRFSGDARRYPTVLTRYEGIECMNRSPMIYANGAHDIALTGRGTLDAELTASWNTGADRAYLETLVANGVDPSGRVIPGSGRALRTSFVQPYACDRVLIEGVTLRNARFWQLHPTLCTNVVVDGVTTRAREGNTDGCDPESCDHVVIRGCDLGAGDDCIAIKSGRDADGRRIATPSQNIVIADCALRGKWGAIACGSEQTGGIRGVYAHRCTVAGGRYVLYVKSNSQRGGSTRDVHLDRIVAHDQTEAFAAAMMDYDGQTGDHPPSFGDFSITMSVGFRAPRVLQMSGLPGHPIAGLTVEDCRFARIDDDDLLTDVVDVRVARVEIDGASVTR